ncbi:hypothetical protein [Streptomyces sp. NPDC020742]|uniref:hypothetical protein n=1 Tax=Streptomyces sp. NPDC020742 TaxID=3154897 RepID=UPI0033F3A195
MTAADGSPGRPTLPPSPEVLWWHAATLAAWSAEHPLPVHNYRVDEAGLHSEDIGNGWWALALVEGGRAVLYGVDHDYSDTLSHTPPLDLLAGGPHWLPWEWLATVIDGGEEIGFVYWWADGAWGRAPYPAEAVDDGVSAMVPADDAEVRAVLAALREDGAAPEELRRKETEEARAAAVRGIGRPELPAGSGEPAGRRVPCPLPEQYAGVLAVAMRAAEEPERPVPGGSGAEERLATWLRAHHPWVEGRCTLVSAFADGADPGNRYRRDAFLDEQGRWLGEELSGLLADLREADAADMGGPGGGAAGDAYGRWLYVRVEIGADGVTVDRAHDHLPRWWQARYGGSMAWPGTLAREMGRRALQRRPGWARLLDEDIPRTGAPAELCAVLPQEAAVHFPTRRP